jgi:hypothetical protein
MNNQQDNHEKLREKERERGMIIGMLMFFPVGIALSAALGNPGMIGVGVAVGLSVGLAIGDRRYKERAGKGFSDEGH